MIPQFTMSQYATKEALLEAKCAWLEGQIEWIEQAKYLDVWHHKGDVCLTIYFGQGVATHFGESLLDCIDQAQEKEKANGN